MRNSLKITTLFLLLSCLFCAGCSHALVSNLYDKKGERGPSSSYTGKGSSKNLHIQYTKHTQPSAITNQVDDIVVRDVKGRRYIFTRVNGKVIIQLVK